MPRWKWLELPFFSFQGTSLDITALVGLTILFTLGLGALLFARRKTPWRYVTLVLAFGLFVLGVHRTLCILRGWVFGVQMIGYDDRLAFAYTHIAVALIAIALVGGGLFCGWICPVGALQELIGRVWGKVRHRWSPRAVWWSNLSLNVATVAILAGLLVRYSPANFIYSEMLAALVTLLGLCFVLLVVLLPALDRRVRWLRSVNLVVQLAVVGIGIWSTSPGCPLYAQEVDYSAVIALTGVLLASLVFVRAYCRYICPFGAVFGWLSPHALVKVQPAASPCVRGCGQCDLVCPVGALRQGTILQSACIRCGRCVEHCQSRVVFDFPVPEDRSSL
jgi:polyferredoxin